MESLNFADLIPQEVRDRIGTLDPVAAQKKIAEIANSERGNLTGYDCPKCLNRGWFLHVDDEGHRSTATCDCMKIRASRHRIEASGLSDIMKRCTFETWQTPELWQKTVGNQAWRYSRRPEGWFVIAGSVGAGKTHLCTAICKVLIEAGKDVRFLPWRDFSTKAKGAITDHEAYRKIVEPVKECEVLYIDDLFKYGRGIGPTAADVTLAFEILNYRYNDSGLITMISTELSLEQIVGIDRAVGSRITERSRGSYIYLADKPNWRLK